MDVALISPKNGVGLQKEGELLSSILPNMTWYDGRTMDQAYYRRRHTHVIFGEVIRPSYLQSRAASYYVLPDAEWFHAGWHQYKGRFVGAICKTRQAVLSFAKRGWKTFDIGFTSQDKYRPEVPRRDDVIGFFPGLSMYKNHQIVIETWKRYPDLPPLHIYTPKTEYAGYVGGNSNIQLILGYLSDEEYAIAQNRYIFHLCPSNAEGFGHYIHEPLSCDATVITTNGAPMNEEVTTNLIPINSTRALAMGLYHTITPEALYKAVMARQVVTGNRERYLQRRQSFITKFVRMFT